MEDINVVPVSLEVIKSIEKIFIENGHTYFTDGKKDYSSGDYLMAFDKTSKEPLINLDDFINKIKMLGLYEKVEMELSIVLDKTGLEQWFVAQKKLRSQSVDLTKELSVITKG